MARAVRRRKSRVGMVLAIGLLAGACAQTIAFNKSAEFMPSSPSPRILLMPADIELSELSAAGIAFPKAEWTTAAIDNVGTAIEGFMASRNATLIAYQAPPAASPEAYLRNQIIKLHGAVGNAVLAHGFFATNEGGPMTLETELIGVYRMIVIRCTEGG